MQYDLYRAKMKRVAGVLGKLYARRFMILVALVAVMALSAVLVMTRGLLVLESSCPAETTYGDPLGFKPLFLLSKTHYEYAVEGSTDWKAGKPKAPGTYSIRAWGKTSFGDRTYTDTYEITVLPRELTLTVTNTTPAYGDLPTVRISGLAKGDTASCDVILAEYNTPVTTAYPNLRTLRITDKKGNDRLSCYTVTDPQRVTVQFKPRPLTVTVRNASKTFDDTPLSFDGYEITSGTLLHGDNLVAVFRDRLTDAGTKTNTPDLQIYNTNGLNVTELYDITIKSGKLTVDQRPLIIRAGSSTFVYNGGMQNYPQYFLDASSSLVAGHRLEVKSSSTIRDVGTAPNVLVFAVYDKRGVEETRNYSIFVEEGTLTVTPRAVSIHTQSGSLVYDGTDQSYPYVTVENGVGDEYRAVSPTTLRDVGSAENRMTVKFYRDGKDITSNYIMNGYTYGTLEITRRPLSVHLKDETKIYDTAPLKAGSFTVNPTPYTLPKGHTLTLEAKGEVTFGSVPHTYVKNSARVTDETGRDVTKNYKITVTDGTLTVTPRPLTVSSEGNVKVYDGMPLSQNKWSITAGSLLDGHEISVTLTGVSITDAGTATNSFERHLTRIYDKKTGEDVSMYYDVTYAEGMLEIQGRPITITTNSAAWMYDATEHRGDGTFDIVGGSLLAGHTAEPASVSGVILNAGTAPNSLSVRIMNGRLDVTHNYKINYAYGTLTVTKRPITVRASSLSIIYDGGTHAANSARLAPDSPYPLAVSYHDLRVRETDMLFFTNAGSYINDPTVSVYDTRTGVYVTGNYEITRYDGTVTIEKRPLHIQLNGEKVYDGRPMDESDYSIAYLYGSTLAKGHTAKAYPTEIHYGSAYTQKSHIEQSSLTVTDPYGNNVRKNYDVHFYEGTLTVTRRPISLVTASAEKTYDGTPLVAYDVTLAPDSLPLVNGDEACMTVIGSQTEVGQSKNTALPETFVICDVLGQDATENYELVSVTEGTLTVKYPATITVTTGSAEKPYDGMPLYCRDYTLSVAGDPLPADCAVYVDVTGYLIYPGSKANTATVTVRDGEGNDVTHLFTVELRTGVLTVTEESINASFGKVYSDRSGIVYLRAVSYGSYNGQGWNTATPYTGTLSGGHSLNLLPAAVLGYLKLPTSTLRFADMRVFLLPYYTAMNGSNPVVGSDVDYTATDLDGYDVTYYPVENTLSLLEQFSKIPFYLRPIVLGSYSTAEQSYRAFVHKQYLTLDEETREFMELIIALQGFDSTDPSVVGDVAAYIRTAARYDLNYDPALDNEPNVAVAFLRDYREGVCTHYATAATLLYRALGIPARYVTGFAVEVTAGEWSEIGTVGHAWVEVYVDGLGWVQVEVTGSADTPVDPDVPVDPVPPAAPKSTLTLIPAFSHKPYDGTPLYAANELVLTPELEALLALGYTYEVTVSGSLTDVGQGVSIVSGFTLYDADGVNVTSSFRLVKEEGLLLVTRAALEVMLYPVVKTYDGSPALWREGDYALLSAPDGLTLTLQVTLPADAVGLISLSEVNRSSAAYATWRILQNGADVTANYELVFTLPTGMEETPVLTVNPRTLELTAASETRIYNGEALSNSTVYLTKGSLAKGHTLTATASGSITAVGRTENIVTAYKILDADGRDVTALYRVTTVDGELIVFPDPDA